MQRLQARLSHQHAAFSESCRGRVFPVLFEKPGRKPGQAVGRSPYLQPVPVDGAAHLIGRLRDVRIVDVLPNSLKGELADGHVPAESERVS